MDGGLGINIIYISTVQRLDIPLEALRSSTTEFHGIVRGNKVAPIVQITLEVAFGTPFHYPCEPLPFEVVPFVGGYDAVLARMAFAKFMAIPNYAYMQMRCQGLAVSSQSMGATRKPY